MKMLHIVERVSAAIFVDFAKNTVESVNPANADIDYVYIAPEDTEVRYTDKKGKITTLKANKGDIIIKFYNYEKWMKNPIIIIKNKQWSENLKAWRDYVEERQSNDCKCCSDCERGCPR